MPSGVARRAARSLPYCVRAAGHTARRHARIILDQGIEAYARWTLLKAAMSWRRRSARHAYRFIGEHDARARRRSSRVFVFGSGYSLNDLTADEWRHIAEHDVLGFSGFVYQQWVRADFHLIRGWDYGEATAHRRWYGSAAAYAARIRENPRFADTVFVMQDEYLAVFARSLIGCRLLPPGSTILPYRTADPRRTGPSPSLASGLAHVAGTLCDAVNLASVLGWGEIVLVGVDLYDSRYFWAGPDATIAFDAAGELVSASRNFRGTAAADVHPVVRNGVVETMAQWAAVFARHGVQLSVYNPRSLVAQALPVYDRTNGRVAASADR